MRLTRSVLLAGVLLIGLLLPAVGSGQEKVATEQLGKLSGRIVGIDGKPFFPGFVSLFKSDHAEPMDVGGTLRSPTMIAFLKEGGVFVTDYMPTGNYYLGALKREHWGMGGPPRPGETRYSAVDEKGTYAVFTVTAGTTTDVGDVTVREPTAFPERANAFTINGTVLDEQGRGQAGMLVLVKKNYDESKAAYISRPTDFMGRYSIRLPPGKYFLIARDSLTKAGRPKPDSKMGVLGQSKAIGIGGKADEPPAYIIGKAGETYNDVDIIMFKVPVPDVRRAEIEAKVKASKIDKAALPDYLPLKNLRKEEGVPSPIQAAPANK